MNYLLCDWFLPLYRNASPLCSQEEQIVVWLHSSLFRTYNKLESLANNLESSSFLLLWCNELHIPINRRRSSLLMLRSLLIDESRILMSWLVVSRYYIVCKDREGLMLRDVPERWFSWIEFPTQHRYCWFQVLLYLIQSDCRWIPIDDCWYSWCCSFVLEPRIWNIEWNTVTILL